MNQLKLSCGLLLSTVSRLHCESESFKMDLILDVNIQIYPVDLGKEHTFCLCIFMMLNIGNYIMAVCLSHILNSICIQCGHSKSAKFPYLISVALKCKEIAQLFLTRWSHNCLVTLTYTLTVELQLNIPL